MKTITNTIDLNEPPEFYSLSQIMQREHDEFKDWEMRNDMIKRVVAVNCTECSAHVRETDDTIDRDFDRLEAQAVAAWNRRAGEGETK